MVLIVQVKSRHFIAKVKNQILWKMSDLEPRQVVACGKKHGNLLHEIHLSKLIMPHKASPFACANVAPLSCIQDRPYLLKVRSTDEYFNQYIRPGYHWKKKI